MPSMLSDADRETVKRVVPKPGNKIFAVAVARLYVAYPNRQRWTYTGLSGAAVLANDLIGNTCWIKLVDISEIYEPFYYNQDRTFFHSFELEDCLAGLSFVDEKDAKTFKKKMDEREKYVSKATKTTPFQGMASSAGTNYNALQEKHHGRFSNLLHGHRPSHQQPQQMQSILPPRQPAPAIMPTQAQSNASAMASLDEVDPSWRGMLGELMSLGITEDQIAENAEFIKSYILDQQKANGASNGIVASDTRTKVPPPPPAVPPGGHKPISPQPTGGTTASKRGAPPPPPAPRRSTAGVPLAPSPPRQATPPRTPSPPRPRFRAPPPIADAGKFAHENAPPVRNRAQSNAQLPGPPPPPRPPKTPEEPDERGKHKFGVPPAFSGQRSVPPPAPARGSVPPPPPRSRD
ncbi:MAG: hypothetical protein LQ340_007864, partial [Diploschistes diacapsis]